MSTAYLFPGQGSQKVGMGRLLIERYPAACRLYEQADELLDFSLTDLCVTGDAETLQRTEYQQIAVFVTSLALWQVANTKPDFVRPAYFAGHSLGEITALTAAGSLSFAAGLRVVQERGRLMASVGGGMLAVLGIDAQRTEALCAEARQSCECVVSLANYNSPVEQVVSGEPDGLKYVAEAAKRAGALRAVRLPISIASHCELMRESAINFAHFLEDIPINQPRIPVISNITAQPLPAPRRIRAELSRQLIQPVRWMESIQTLRDRGVDRFVEIGPGNVLTKLMKRIDNSATRETFQL